jgi:nicotinic acetylcholine receptor
MRHIISKKKIIKIAQVDLRHMEEKSGSNVVDVGVDLSEFYSSVEWDILEVPAVRYDTTFSAIV